MILKKLRELHLKVAPQAGRPAHLSAASGLVRVHDFLYVVADDELHLGVFSATSNAPGELIRLLPGELPDDAAERKALKADFEALLLLEPFAGYPHGALFIWGSGSKRTRRRGVLLALDARGEIASLPRALDLSGLFKALKRQVSDLNIEGAVVSRDRLLLLQRGNKGEGVNAIVTMDLATLLKSIANDDRVGKLPLRDVRIYDLGRIEDVPLCFTDAAATPDGSVIFTAIAEDTSDSYRDGVCLGAAIGVIGADGELRSLQRLDPVYKVEGVHAEMVGDVAQLLLVTDADDASIPASLYSAEIALR